MCNNARDWIIVHMAVKCWIYVQIQYIYAPMLYKNKTTKLKTKSKLTDNELENME